LFYFETLRRSRGASPDPPKVSQADGQCGNNLAKRSESALDVRRRETIKREVMKFLRDAEEDRDGDTLELHRAR